ncbi:MAG: DUF2459 domain-containing protein [Rhodospirillales bacterium]|nr:DUF2459 domain-containing protein [Rhodospirillales bacterium]
MPRLTRPLRCAAAGALLGLLAGCAGAPAPSAPLAQPRLASPGPPAPGSGTVVLLTHGWHTDIAVPVTKISEPLRGFVARFGHARTIVFGYGKRSFMTSREHTVGDWLTSILPGAGALEISALRTDATTAYGASHSMTLALPPGGEARLSAFIWQTLRKDAAGQPVAVGHGDFPGSLVFATASGYDVSHTCNTWSAQALAATGLPIRADGITFSSQIDAAAAPFAARASAAR